MLLSHGAEIDGKTNKNQTALMLAVQNGHYDVVDELLRNEADIHISDDSEKALLDIASQQSNYMNSENKIRIEIVIILRKFNYFH